MQVSRIVTKDIDRCYHGCPYFELDGGPGPVMCCGHPEAPNNGYIISHPECNNGFPELCPEAAKNTKKSDETIIEDNSNFESVPYTVKIGEKVRLLTLNAGWPGEEKTVEKLINKDIIYTVSNVEVGSWCTYISLEEIPGRTFNTVFFKYA